MYCLKNNYFVDAEYSQWEGLTFNSFWQTMMLLLILACTAQPTYMFSGIYHLFKFKYQYCYHETGRPKI